MRLMLPLAQVGSLQLELLDKLAITSLIGPPVHGRQKVRPITLQVLTDNEYVRFSVWSANLLPNSKKYEGCAGHQNYNYQSAINLHVFL